MRIIVEWINGPLVVSRIEIGDRSEWSLLDISRYVYYYIITGCPVFVFLLCPPLPPPVSLYIVAHRVQSPHGQNNCFTCHQHLLITIFRWSSCDLHDQRIIRWENRIAIIISHHVLFYAIWPISICTFFWIATDRA